MERFTDLLSGGTAADPAESSSSRSNTHPTNDAHRDGVVTDDVSPTGNVVGAATAINHDNEVSRAATASSSSVAPPSSHPGPRSPETPKSNSHDVYKQVTRRVSMDSSSCPSSSPSASSQANSGTNSGTKLRPTISLPSGLRVPSLKTARSPASSSSIAGTASTATAAAGENLSQDDYRKTKETAPCPPMAWRLSSSSSFGKLAEPDNASHVPDHEAAAQQDGQASLKPPPCDQVNAAWIVSDKTLTKALESTSSPGAEACTKQPMATAADDHQATGTQADKYDFHAESKNHETDAFLKSLHDGESDYSPVANWYMTSILQIYDNETASLDSCLWLRKHGLLDSDDEIQQHDNKLGGRLFQATGYTTDFVLHNGAAGWQEVLQVAAEIRFWVMQKEHVGQVDCAAVAFRIRTMVQQGQRTLLAPRGANKDTVFLLQEDDTIVDNSPTEERTREICPTCQGQWCFANDGGKKYMKDFMKDVGRCVKCAQPIKVRSRVDAFNGRGRNNWPGVSKFAHLGRAKTDYANATGDVKKQLELDVLFEMLKYGGLVVRQWPPQRRKKKRSMVAWWCDNGRRNAAKKKVHVGEIQYYAVTNPCTVSEKVRKALAEKRRKQPAPVVNDNGKLPAKKARGGGGATNK